MPPPRNRRPEDEEPVAVTTAEALTRFGQNWGEHSANGEALREATQTVSQGGGSIRIANRDVAADVERLMDLLRADLIAGPIEPQPYNISSVFVDSERIERDFQFSYGPIPIPPMVLMDLPDRKPVVQVPPSWCVTGVLVQTKTAPRLVGRISEIRLSEAGHFIYVEEPLTPPRTNIIPLAMFVEEWERGEYRSRFDRITEE